MKRDRIDVSLKKRIAKIQEEDLDNFERLLYLLTLRIESQENRGNLDPEIIRELRSLKETIENQSGKNDKLMLNSLPRGLKLIEGLNLTKRLSVSRRYEVNGGEERA